MREEIISLIGTTIIFYKEIVQIIRWYDTVVEKKSEIMLLGVTLDDQLTFDVSNICRKTSCQIGVLQRLRNLIITHC